MLLVLDVQQRSVMRGIRLVRHGVAARYQHALTRSVVTSLSALEAPALLA